MYLTNKKQYFSQSAIHDAIKYVQSKWPEESGGIIVEEEFVPIENSATDLINNYEINNADFDRLYRDGDIQCVIHSHETGSHFALASFEDQQRQIELDIPCGIVSMKNKSVTHVIFWGDQLPLEPVLKRQFFYGIWDCYGLCRDYIRQNMRFTPPNKPREFVFWHTKIDFMGTTMDSMPFIKIPLEEVQPNDFILYNIKGTTNVNHCAVNLENGVLHHFFGQISRILPRSSHKIYARYAVRHNPEWEGYK